ncbi:nuclear transport factor 2 family protein [Zoogloea sp.]|uniref:nuclear transport factor 2 family protein n=1 Tax=Zoogloea sp. TaxID=49181 RepID=UPI00262D44C7|nr:nuclear transport factor 2 family protein [Zoogloea sp.]MDD3352288.1 nuclear transport factor 2 family protein [Zoogloea sp.]
MSAFADPAPVARVVSFYENLSPDGLGRIAEVYAPDAAFKDPFNEVQGLPAIEGVFRHMYEQVHEPRFRVTGQMAQGQEAWLAWEFRFRFKGWREGETQRVRGATHLVFAGDGRVQVHRDYWDTGEELYAKLPLLGRLMRWLQRRLSAS